MPPSLWAAFVFYNFRFNNSDVRFSLTIVIILINILLQNEMSVSPDLKVLHYK